MPKLIVIMGDLAAGKSTFSNKLSKRYQWNVFNKDTIKEVLGDTIGFANREENLKLSKATVELMLFLFSEFCKLDKSLILESNFHKTELDKIKEIAEKYKYDVLILMLRGDMDILHQRFLNRKKNENRHPVHLSASLDDYTDFCNYIERARNEIVTGDMIQVNVNDFSYQEDTDLLSKIDEFANN